METIDQQQAFRDLGDASFYLADYSFGEKKIGAIHEYRPPDGTGKGTVYQVRPVEGMFVSVSDWVPNLDMERRYRLEHKMIKLYYFESGHVTLIQNGKRAAAIREGVNLYLNRPSEGRVRYGAGIPIRYVSVLILEDYFSPFLQAQFTSDDFDYAELFSWREVDYNTPEVGRIFLQIKNKLLSGETSRLYYESKAGELLSIVGGNFRRQRKQMEQIYNSFSPHERKALERVRLAVERNILNPPTSEELCKIATMGHTKFRRAFRLLYGLSPREYILKARMQYAQLLLSRPEPSIAAIAARLGYASASKFSIAFRKIYNQSPKEYRKAVREGSRTLL